MSAANEETVQAFLDGRINWVQIAETVERVMESYSPSQPRDIEDVLHADAEGRRLAAEVLAR